MTYHIISDMMLVQSGHHIQQLLLCTAALDNMCFSIIKWEPLHESRALQ